MLILTLCAAKRTIRGVSSTALTKLLPRVEQRSLIL